MLNISSINESINWKMKRDRYDMDLTMWCVCVCACAYIFCVHYFLADERERGDTTRATSEYWPPHVVTEEHIQHYPQTAGKDRTVDGRVPTSDKREGTASAGAPYSQYKSR